MKKIIFSVKGMTCSACVAHVERAVRGVVGENTEFVVSLLSSSLIIQAEEKVDEAVLFKKISTALSRAGYSLVDQREVDDEEMIRGERKRQSRRLWLSVGITAVLMIVAMWHMTPIPAPFILDAAAYPRAFFVLQFVLAGAVIVLNRHFFKNGFSALFHFSPNMDSLVALGSFASVAYGVVAGVFIFIGSAKGDAALVHEYLHELYLESAAMILTLVSVGKYLEGRARGRAAQAVRALIEEEPLTARVKRGDTVEEIPLSELLIDDIVIVPTGEKIAADGVVVSGEGSVNEAMLTGEAMPRTVKEGDRVSGATLLVEGTLYVKVEKVGEETVLRRIVALLEETAASKAPVQRVADKVSAVFVPVVMGISLVTAIVWLILTQNVAMAFRAAVSVLVISCPCALGLATPTAITVGCGRAARFGILFKSAEALEVLAGVRVLLTDKTGTLTKGDPAVVEAEALSGSMQELLDIAASLEALSSHPLAKPIAAQSKVRLPLTDFTVLTGRGVFAREENGTIVSAGSEALFSGENGIPCLTPEAKELARRWSDAFYSVVLVARGDRFLGGFAIADVLREDSKDAVAALKNMNIKTVMLTGDHPAVAKQIAEEAGIFEYRAGLLPADKERIVHEYSQGAPSAMVGDGINDAPALARADVGLAIGAGTGVAVESAGVVLSGNSLMHAVAAVELGRATKRNILQNLFWALFYNALCIPLAAGVLYPALGIMLTPMIASAAMSLSSVFVVLNALRLSRFVPNCLKNQVFEEKEKKNMLFGKKETQTTQLHVEGMMCKMCVAHVENALKKIGANEVKIDLASGLVEVTAPAKLTPEKMTSAIIAAGYRVV